MIVLSKQNLEELRDIPADTKNLNVSQNKLQHLKQLPESLSSLNASYNLIMNTLNIPLKNLVVLNLAHNKITSMKGLENLPNLGALILNHNEISKVPAINAPKLNTLVLSSNKIQVFDVAIPNLKKLQLSHNQIVSLLIKCPQLQYLHLKDNKLTMIPDQIQWLTKLRLLDIGDNKLTDLSDVESLRQLKLMNLIIQGNPFEKEALELIAGFPFLRFVGGLSKEKALEPRPSKPLIHEVKQKIKKIRIDPLSSSEIKIVKEDPIIQKKKSGIVEIKKSKVRSNKVSMKQLSKQQSIEKW